MKGIDQIQNVAQVDLTNVYMVVGFLIVMNLGAIATGVTFVIKLVWLASKYDSRIEKMEKDVNNAFKSIKELVDEVKDLNEKYRSVQTDLTITKEKLKDFIEESVE